MKYPAAMLTVLCLSACSTPARLVSETPVSVKYCALNGEEQAAAVLAQAKCARTGLVARALPIGRVSCASGLIPGLRTQLRVRD